VDERSEKIARIVVGMPALIGQCQQRFWATPIENSV